MSACLPRASEGDAATPDTPDAPPLDAPPLDAPPLDAPPLDTPPLDTPPLDTPPLDTPPLDTPPLDARDATAETASDVPSESSLDVLTPDVLAPDVATSPDIAAPRPIAPHLSTRVASGRPTFDWALPSGVDGARLELCRDRACTMMVSSVAATGSTYTPPTALAAGLYFWRLGGVRGGVFGSARSATRSLFIGGTSSDDAAGLGISRDLNGDGLSDMLVRWPATGVDALLGRATGRPTVQRTFTTDVPTSIVGDVNGDGFADALSGASLYLGSREGLPAMPIHALADPTAEGVLWSGGAGDVNGDGFADVLRITPSRIELYLGSRAGLSMAPQVITAPTGTHRACAAVGDVNGDGFSDLTLGTGGYRSMTAAVSGDVYIFVGSRAGIVLPAFATWGALGVPFDSATRQYPVIVSDRRRPQSVRRAPVCTSS